jgi:hypothetical protein
MEGTMAKNIIHLVFESGSGYGASFNAFHKKEDAKDYFKGVCEAESAFEDLSPEEQKEVLDAEEFRFNGDELIQILPISVS